MSIVKTLRATFNPSADSTKRGIGTYTLAGIPTKAVVTKVWYEVITTFTSATDAATLALSIKDADDVVAAVAISDGSNPWDASRKGTKIGYPNLGADAAHDSQAEVNALVLGTWIKTTAKSKLQVAVAVEALTAGKLNVFAEYVISE